MRTSRISRYFLPPKPQPKTSPFTRPTTFIPSSTSSSSINKKISKQTDFNHLIQHAIPASVKGTSSRPSLGIRKEFYFVHFDDRIKFWNLTAGDRVIISNCTKDFRGKIGTIYWVDRTTNRLGLIEPEFWTEERQVPHPELPELIRSRPIEFEYESVRLMAPGSDEMYYEDLEEVDHESISVPGKRRLKEIHWTRIGNRYSIRSLKQQNDKNLGKEIIPWPLKPNWTLDIQDSFKRLNIRDDYFKRLREHWEVESRRENGEIIEPPPPPTSHVHSRETRKDLFSSPIDSWKTTLDPTLYEDQSIWLSTSDKIRQRFFPVNKMIPDYNNNLSRYDKDEIKGEGDHKLSISSILPPELLVPDWELRAGQNTKRFKTTRWESNLNSKIQSKIQSDLNFILAKLPLINKSSNNSNEEEQRRKLQKLFKIGYHRPSLVEKPKRMRREPSEKEIKRAKMIIDELLEKSRKVERLATLDLLPALEEFNSKFESYSQTKDE